VLKFSYHADFPRRLLEERDVAECETYLNVALPQDFRAFILARDGPVPDPAWFPVMDANASKWFGPMFAFLSVMFSCQLRRSRGNAIEAVTYASREEQKLPRHFVAIGSMLTQPSTLLLSTAAASYGHIFAWHVGIKRFKPDQLVRVAGSFTEFLGLLTQPPAEVAANYLRLDEERSAARRDGTEQRLPESEYDGPEARRWLRRNRNPTPLAANHFASAESARRFVEELYAAGATRVLVPGSCLQDVDDDGPYADALVVCLPNAPDLCAALCRRCERELDEPVQIDASDPNPVFLWWT